MPVDISTKAVALFGTCLVNCFYPRIGQAVVRVLERLGFRVDYPSEQTCCGLPFYNSGYRPEAAKLARSTVRAMEGRDPIVVPAGSCAWMLKNVYPTLIPDGSTLAARVIEFSSFLDGLPEWQTLPIAPAGSAKVTYHASCHLLRGLGSDKPPKQVLNRACNAAVCPMERETECCGFGGSFAVRYPEVSAQMLEDKIACAEKSGAGAIVVTDPGCLMQIEGGLRRKKSLLGAIHLAELIDRGLGGGK